LPIAWLGKWWVEELPALEVHAGRGEHGQDLEGEEHLAVEVLVQRVPVRREGLVLAAQQR